MKSSFAKIVAVLGASPKPQRYSNKAIKMLKNHGYCVIPIHPTLDKIEGLKVIADLKSITEKVDTLTLYIGPQRSAGLIDSIIGLKPNRVIFNPGTESEELELKLMENHIPYVKDCTLIMLEHDRF